MTVHFEFQSSGPSSSPVRAHSGALAPDPAEPPAPRFAGTAGAAPPSAPAPNASGAVTLPHKGEGDPAAAMPGPSDDHRRLTVPPDSPPPCGEGSWVGVPRAGVSAPAATSCIRTEDGTVILLDRATGRAVSA